CSAPIFSSLSSTSLSHPLIFLFLHFSHSSSIIIHPHTPAFLFFSSIIFLVHLGFWKGPHRRCRSQSQRCSSLGDALIRRKNLATQTTRSLNKRKLQAAICTAHLIPNAIFFFFNEKTQRSFHSVYLAFSF
ncbi:unnamed protein product, partial [Prunus brigantina]